MKPIPLVVRSLLAGGNAVVGLSRLASSGCGPVACWPSKGAPEHGAAWNWGHHGHAGAVTAPRPAMCRSARATTAPLARTRGRRGARTAEAEEFCTAVSVAPSGTVESEVTLTRSGRLLGAL